MSQTDRIAGLVGNSAIKVPCRAGTTANIVLSGAQTIDGVALVTDDRVLVKNQTTASENGIYVADTGAWARAPDWDGPYDIVKGTMVRVTDGATLSDSFWAVSSANPLTIGTSSVAFTQVNNALLGVSAYIATLLDEADAAAFRNSIGIAWCGTATGTANALVLTPAQAITALVAGIQLDFKSGAAANTAATTIAVSGLAATAVQSNGVACVGGEIEASKWYRATYDGAAFQLERLAPAVLLEMFTTKGDTLIATADQTLVRKAAPAPGSVRTGDTNQSDGVRDIAPFRSYLAGLGLTNNAGDATNDIDIAVGGAMSSDNTYWMTLAAGLTKQLDAVWAVGTNQGMLASGAAIADTTYHIFLIARPDTGVVDIAADTSASGANIAANTNAAYTKIRRIGSIIRSGGAIVLFTQLGDEFLLKTPVSAFSVGTPGSSAVLRALSTPVGIKLLAKLSLSIETASRVGETPQLLVTSPDQTDVVPSGAVFSVRVAFNGGADEQGEGCGFALVRTDTSAQVRTRVSPTGGANVLIQGVTDGWLDSRGKDD